MQKLVSVTLVITFFFTCISVIGFCQEAPKKMSYGNQQWVQYYNRLKLNEKYTLLSDGSFRWKNYFKNNNLALLRTGLMYKLNENISLTLGIASTLSFNNNKVTKTELRGWQEFLLSSRISRLYISNRFRLEERYFKNVTDNAFGSGYAYNYRFRYRLYVSIPLNNNSIKEKTLSVNIGDEIFINFGKEILYNTFDNNRILLGFSYQINKKQSLTLNYVNQLTHTKAYNTYENNDILWLSFTHLMGLKEKKKEKEN